MTFRVITLLAVLLLMGCGSQSDLESVDLPDEQVEQDDHAGGTDVYARPNLDGKTFDLEIGEPEGTNPKAKKKQTAKKSSSLDSSEPPIAKKKKQKDELFFRGTTLTQWKKQARDLDPKFRAPAIEALSVIGQHLPDAEIVRLLTDTARHETFGSPNTIRLNAIVGLAQIAERYPNAEVLKTFFGLLRTSDRKVRTVAAAAIAKLQKCWSLPDSLRWVRNSVQSEDRLESTVSALVLLSQSTADARLALHWLTRLYAKSSKSGSADNNQPDEAMESLSKGFTVAYLRCIPHVLAVLREKESSVTVTAMLVLAASLSLEKPSTIHDQHIAAAVKILLPSLKSQSAEVRATAATVLGEIRSTDSQVGIELFNRMRNDASPLVRIAAANALGQLADVHEEIVPALLAIVRDTRASGRELAVTILGNVLAEEHPGTRDVLIAIRDADAVVRAAAVSAIERIGLPERRLVATLQFALQYRHHSVRTQAAHGLGRLGEKAKRAAESLHVAFDRETNKEARVALATAIRRITGEPDVKTRSRQARGSEELKR